LKTWQENLGKVQDTYVLASLLADQPYPPDSLSQLHGAMADKRQIAMADWETLRQRYLTPRFRQTLYTQVLNPQIEQVTNPGENFSDP
jgi:CHAD domain-containing protein